MNPRAFTGLVYIVAVLLAIVVVVGLAQRNLDATGVAVALSSVITGLVGGSLVRSKIGNTPPEDKADGGEKK